MRAIFCVLLAGSAMAADWPQWRGPDETGISRENVDPASNLEIAWKTRVGTGFAGIAVAGGQVFTMGHNGDGETVWCLDAKTGAVIWKHDYPAKLLPNLHEGGPAATPTIDENRVFTLSKDGQAHGYDRQTGERLWQVNLGRPPEWGFAGSPYLFGENLVLFEAGATVALNRETGAEIWRSARFKPGYGTPIAFDFRDATFIAVLKNDEVAILDSAGKTAATAPWKTSFSTNSTTPIVDSGRVFVSTGYGRGCALFRFTGSALEQVYEMPSMSNHMNNSVLIGGHLYGFDGTAHRGPKTRFACVELATGKARWRADGLGCGSVIAGKNGTLIILTERGEIWLAKASPDEFVDESRAQILGGRCWTAPALAGGRIFARNAAGDLVCVDLQAP